jgi:hypothetical protein
MFGLDPVALHVLVQVRRCDEMERKLRFLEKEIKKDSIPMMETTEPPDAPQPRQDNCLHILVPVMPTEYR